MNDLINTTNVQKLIRLIRKGLASGLGSPKAGQMCVEAVICTVLYGEFSDQPDCVHRDIIPLKILINDFDWPSKQARARGMERAAIAQLGSNRISISKWVAAFSKHFIKFVLPLLNNHYLEKPEATKLNKICRKGTRHALKKNLEMYVAMYKGNLYLPAYGDYRAIHLCQLVGDLVENGNFTDDNPWSSIEKERIYTEMAECIVQACIKVRTEGRKYLRLTAKKRK